MGVEEKAKDQAMRNLNLKWLEKDELANDRSDQRGRMKIGCCRRQRKSVAKGRDS